MTSRSTSRYVVDAGRLERIARALGGRRSGAGWVCRCPAHDDGRPSLSLGIGADGRLLLHCFAGCYFRDVISALEERGLLACGGGSGEDARPSAVRLRAERARVEAERLVERVEGARRIWAAARPIAPGDPVDRYLRGRGLRPAGEGWPACLAISADGAGPIMVARLERWPSREVAAVQVTRLTRWGGKRAVEPVRLTYGLARGAAVPIVPWSASTSRAVILVEGVEDGLAVAMAAGAGAILACVGAANAARVELPPRSAVVLALDGDEAGRAAARAAERALAARGHRVAVAEVPDGMDPAEIAEAEAFAAAGVKKEARPFGRASALPTPWRRDDA